jgi:hypothetical protein
MEPSDPDDVSTDKSEGDFIGYDKIEESSAKWLLSDAGTPSKPFRLFSQRLSPPVLLHITSYS